MEEEIRVYKFSLNQFVTKNSVNCNTEPESRSGHRICCINGDIFLIGGYTTICSNESSLPVQKIFKDIYRYNIATNAWTKLETKGDFPESLASHNVTYYKNQIFVYGGTGEAFINSASNSLYVLNFNNLIWTQCQVTGELPDKLYGQGSYLDGCYFYVIGGTSGYSYNMDVHRINLKTIIWEKLFISNGGERHHNEPCPRYRHEVAFYDNILYVFGGTDMKKIESDGNIERSFGFKFLYGFDTVKKIWIKTKMLSEINNYYPAARYGHGLAQHEQDVWIVGGRSHKNVLNDIWKLSFKTMTWTSYNQTLSLPYPISFHSICVTQAGCIYTFGGIIDDENGDEKRTNKIGCFWVKVPTLREMAWEGVQNYMSKLTKNNAKLLIKEGVPLDLALRIN